MPAVVLATLLACSGGPDAHVSSGSSPITGADVGRGEPSPTTGPPTRDDPLERRDVPPDGVPEQLRFSAPVEAPCPQARPGPPGLTPTSGNFEIGERVLICLFGFDAASPISLQLASPSGPTRQLRVDTGRTPSSFLVLGPADPAGAYVITGTQGRATATGGFTAVLPRTPLIVTLNPGSGPRGMVFHFAIVAPSPGQDVPLDLYRRDGSRTSFATTVASARADGQARASYALASDARSPAGDYCLVARPFRLTCADFSVR